MSVSGFLIVGIIGYVFIKTLMDREEEAEPEKSVTARRGRPVGTIRGRSINVIPEKKRKA